MSNGDTVFNYKDDGIIVSSNSDYTEGFGITAEGYLQYGDVNDCSFKDFVSGYPVLVVNGKATTITIASEIDYKARRTVLAYNDDYTYVIAVEAPGSRFADLQKFLVNLGVKYAINLDGGGSTKILKDGTSLTSSIYNRAVDNVVAFYLKPKTIYRVQVGAFSKKSNAEALQTEIRSLDDTISAGYKNAYVRKVGKYYKVQIGAFSVKANATKVLNDLKKKGYSAFITTA